MAEALHAVFLSYASQDAEAAQRICDALRSPGVEVWFDRSELHGGATWDRKIRQQIRDCALFISARRNERWLLGTVSRTILPPVTDPRSQSATPVT